MTHDQPLERLQTPVVVAALALSFFGLVANAQPDALAALWELALRNPIPSAAVVALVLGVCVWASQLSDPPARLGRRITLGLVAVSLFLLVGDALGFLRADSSLWASLIRISAPLILVGGLTSLIVATRRPLG